MVVRWMVRSRQARLTRQAHLSELVSLRLVVVVVWRVRVKMKAARFAEWRSFRRFAAVLVAVGCIWVGCREGLEV